MYALQIPDDATDACMKCNTGFTLFNRKHHCRACGRIFCNDCSDKTVPLPEIGFYEPVRVCYSCFDGEEKRKKFDELYIPMLRKGLMFKKHGRKGLPHERLIQVTADGQRITWCDPLNLKEEKGNLLLNTVTNVGAHLPI